MLCMPSEFTGALHSLEAKGYIVKDKKRGGEWWLMTGLGINLWHDDYYAYVRDHF